MQPRQRSKWRAADGPHSSSPPSSRLIRWMRPRGESDSSPQSEYVGQAGRQNPQCTQVSTSSRVEASATERLHHPLLERLQHWGLTPLLHVGVEDAARQAADDARGSGGAQLARSRPGRRPGARDGRAGRRRPRGARPRAPRRPRRSRRPRARVPARRARPAAGLSKRTSMWPGGQAYSTQAGASGSSDERVGRLGDDGARRGGQRVQAHADPLDRAEPPCGADDEPRQVVAGDVLDDPAAAVDDEPSGSRSATPSSRSRGGP